jgi:hypothetical protein
LILAHFIVENKPTWKYNGVISKVLQRKKDFERKSENEPEKQKD